MSRNSNMTAVLMSAKWCEDRHREKEHVKMRVGRCMYKLGDHQKLEERQGTHPPWSLQRDRGAVHTLISDFCLSEM